MTGAALADRLRTIVRGEVMTDAPLRRYTSFHIGGPAEILVRPADRADLATALGFAGDEGLPVTVLGGGSNTLIRDGGIRGMVVHLQAFQRLERQADEVVAGAGVRTSRLLAFCLKHGVGGLQMLSGIPGTVGGAVWGNAGAWGGAIADRLARVEVITAAGSRVFARAEVPFRYRASGLPAGSVVVEATFALSPEDPAAIRRQVSAYLLRRNATQPAAFRSAGSIFKNPPGDFAGRLVEAAGLKGTRIGNAEISEKHGNYIVNLGDARAADVLTLVALAQERVLARTGIALELEVRVVGEP